MKKVLTWGGIGFLVFFVAFRPDEASGFALWFGGGALAFLNGLADFVTNLTRKLAN